MVRVRSKWRSGVGVSIAFTALGVMLGCDIRDLGAETLHIEVNVRLEQDDRSSGQGYVASYRHRAVHTTSDFIRESTVLDTAWKGHETCYEPPLRIEWESAIDFEDFRYNDPVFHAVWRDEAVWLLYDPALEFGVTHAGQPGCNDGIEPGTMVEKRFFTGNLQEGAAPNGDLPVYLRDEESAVGGFVLLVLPLEELEDGRTFPIAVDYEAEEPDFDIAMRLHGEVRIAE
ncbi:MAG: hypothetical protein OEM62_06725 [Acidobacteriota bacterium]|nr:hypothetical protein [Acidobacteriota bacterium]